MSTQKKIHCYICGQASVRSQLVTASIQTGRSGNGTNYYNDRLICRQCKIQKDNSNRKVLVVYISILVAILTFFIWFVSFVFRKKSTSDYPKQKTSLIRNSTSDPAAKKLTIYQRLGR